MALMKKMVDYRINNILRRQRADVRDREKLVAMQRLSDSIGQGDIGPDLVVQEASPSSTLARQEEVDLVRSCLSELPEQTRTVMRLRHEEGSDWNEIAAQAGFSSPDAARMHYVRARTIVREQLRKRLVRGSES